MLSPVHLPAHPHVYKLDPRVDKQADNNIHKRTRNIKNDFFLKVIGSMKFEKSWSKIFEIWKFSIIEEK